MMKKVLWGLSLLISSVFAEIEWEDYDSAFSIAKDENKVVMIMFSSPTCKVCNYMKSKVYTNEGVQEYLDDNFVSIEIDVNDNPNPSKFKLLGTPNYFFLDAKGKLIQPRMVGGAKAKSFLGRLKSVIKQAKAH